MGWDTGALLLVRISSYVEVRRMAVRIHCVVERQRMLFRPIHRLREIAELGRESTRSDQLHVIGITVVPDSFLRDARVIRDRSSANHIHVELSDNRVARNGRVIGVPLRSVETGFLTNVPNE